MTRTTMAIPSAGSWRTPSRRHSVVLLTSILALVARPLAPGIAVAQPADKQLKILFSDLANDTNPTKTNLRLRPNTPQHFFLYVRNSGGKAATATLELWAGDAAVPGSRTQVTLPAGTTPITLPKPPSPAQGEKPPSPAALPAPLTVRLLGANNEPLDAEEIRVAHATDYVRVTQVTFDPKAKGGKRNRLTVELEALPNFAGPKCRVELVLRADRIQGFVPGQKKEGTYAGLLSRPGEKLRLIADNLRFVDDADHPGSVYLTVDGYERAFLFQTTFVSQGLPTRPVRIDRTIVRLDVPAAAIPSEKTRIGLEIDNLPPGAVAELGFDRDEDGDFQNGELMILTGDRRQEIVLGPPGPSGALQLTALTHDWNPELDTTDIFGKRNLRVRVLNKNKQAIEFLDAKKDEITTEVNASLILDGSAPESVKFVNAPASSVRGAPLSLQATGADPESGIKELVFYIGKPVDGKMPPNAPKVDARLDAKRPTWSGTLAVPADKIGTIDVTAQFTNGVGLSTSETISVQLEEPAKPGQSGKASIAGTVVEGPRPQAGLTVTLTDEKGEKKEAKTTAKGEFQFGDLGPGKYRLSTAKSASHTRGEAAVQLKEGEKKAAVTISLRR